MHPEVLIIGGGVIGLSIARELHKQGVRRIALIERGVCGQEASWAAAGMLSPQVEAGEPGAFFDLCCASRDLYPSFADELLDETGIDIELDKTGTLYLAFNDNEVSEIDNRFEWQSNAGLAVEIMCPDEIKRIEPSISQDVRAALFFQHDWQVENRKLILALRRYAEINGINVCENTKVEKLIVESGGVVGTQTDKGIVTADITVAATGAWTSLIQLGTIDMPIKVEPIRGQIIAFEPKENLIRHVVCSSLGYLVPRIDGRLLAGSTTEKTDFDKSLTESAALLLREMACRIVPDLAEFEISDHWSGLRPYSADGLPMLGSVRGVSGLFVATAHYRNGILLAPLTAKLVANKLVNGLEQDQLIQFGADRFYSRSVGLG